MVKFVYIFNFGDYFARLTAKKIRMNGGRPKIISFNTPYRDLVKPAGFILSGSPSGSRRLPSTLLNRDIFSSNYPIMGICIGAQLMTRSFGGSYKGLKRRAENGIATLHIDRRNKLFRGLKNKEEIVMLHEDSIVDPGRGFIVSARTERCPVAAAWHEKWRWYALQFHPELSPCGDVIFRNFVNLCYHDKPEFKPRRDDVIINQENRTIRIKKYQYS